MAQAFCISGFDFDITFHFTVQAHLQGRHFLCSSAWERDTLTWLHPLNGRVLLEARKHRYSCTYWRDDIDCP